MANLFDPNPQIVSTQSLIVSASEEARLVAPAVLQALHVCCHPARKNDVSLEELEGAMVQQLVQLSMENPTEFYAYCIKAVAKFWQENALSAQEMFEGRLRESGQNRLQETLSLQKGQEVFAKSKTLIEKWEQDLLKNATQPTSKTLLSSLVEQSFRPKEGPVSYNTVSTSSSTTQFVLNTTTQR